MVQISSRSYGGKYFRPTPTLVEIPSHRLVILLTTWGASVPVDRIQSLIEEVFADSGDPDMTVIGTKNPRPQTGMEKLFLSFSQVNNFLIDEVNKEKFTSGIGMTILQIGSSSTLWMSIGGPSLVWVAPDEARLLKHEIDLSSSLSVTAPLPSNLLGLGEDVRPFFGQLKNQKDTRLIALERSHLPKELFSLKEINEETIASVCAKDAVDQPFWISTIQNY